MHYFFTAELIGYEIYFNVLFFLVFYTWICISFYIADKHYHRFSKRDTSGTYKSPWSDVDWNAFGRQSMEDSIKKLSQINHGRAKNVIMFLGDGMGLPTIAAARLYQTETRNLKREETYLPWERFPFGSLSRVNNIIWLATQTDTNHIALVPRGDLIVTFYIHLFNLDDLWVEYLLIFISNLTHYSIHIVAIDEEISDVTSWIFYLCHYLLEDRNSCNWRPVYTRPKGVSPPPPGVIVGKLVGPSAPLP